jgi:hypothetical protein
MNTVTGTIPAGRLRPSFWRAILANLIWINASEVFRYFVFVMPMMRKAFPEVSAIAPMNFPVFLIWGVWDTILVLAATAICWLILERFGNSVKNAVLAGIAVWFTVFVILWLGLFNMNLATPAVLAIALPLSLIEMVVASLVVRLFIAKR